MNISGIQPNLSNPAGLSTAKEDPRLDESLSQFEALFVGMLLDKALRGEDGGDGEEEEGLLGGGPGGSVLGGLVKDTFAREVAKSGSLGIGEQLRQALQKNGQ